MRANLGWRRYAALRAQPAALLLVLAVALALAALVGWAFDVPPLRELIVGRVPMHVQTALALLLAACGVFAVRRGSWRAALAVGVALIAWGGATTFDHAVHGATQRHPGRMAFHTAVCVVGLGLGLVLSGRPSRAALRVRELTLLFVFGVAYVAVVGHVFGARVLFMFATTHMAMNTAIALLAICVALLLLPPHGVIVAELARAGEGGWVARRLLPVALIVPVMVGWLRLIGEAGGHFDTPDGASILVVTNTALFVVATWWVARIANRLAYERTRAFTQLRETEIEREVRMRFVRSLAHDLRAPLSAIRVGAERLAKTTQGDTANARVAEVVIRGVDRLGRMVSDLLDVERLRAGQRIEVSRVSADAGAIVERVVQTFSVLHGDRIRANIERPLDGRWDEGALERILENLIGNAFKYGAEGGLVTVSARAAGERVCLAVHNDGNPLRASEIPRLLEPFHRGADTAGRAGWGIGLPLVHGLTEALGGRLEIESGADSGTTFRVLLPRA